MSDAPDPAAARSAAGGAEARRCGGCTLCCTVLRVDALGKLGGVPCRHLRPEDAAEGPGCGIHATRPGICRAYRCLWLAGGLEEGDRPDRLGAVLDVVAVGETHRLEIREAEPGAYDRSPRLREIAGRYLGAMPVRITWADGRADPDAPFRVLLPGGEEQRVAGDRVTVLRGGRVVAERRLPWLERAVRRALLAGRGLRIRWAAWRHSGAQGDPGRRMEVR